MIFCKLYVRLYLYLIIIKIFIKKILSDYVILKLDSSMVKSEDWTTMPLAGISMPYTKKIISPTKTSLIWISLLYA